MDATVQESLIENSDGVVLHNNDENLPSTAPQDKPKKSKKEERNKKDDKNAEQFIKSLNSLPNSEEKFASLSKKYTQTADENKKLQFYIKQSDKRHALLLKEKEHLQHEYNKAVLLKSKLENLCRELQKQNKAIKEESILKIREEEERRKETQAKFQNTLSEITTLLQQNNDKNAKLRDDNISMSEKFKSVVQQYQLREQQVDKMAKQMLLESQLSDAKLQKASLEHQAERERQIAEMEQLKVTLAQYKTKIIELQGTETALKGQLAVYTDKYDEFQNALVKSNQMFGGFKEQMEMMSKKIKKLEKESLSWKKRWETSQTALLDMCGERQASEERSAATGRQLQQMQSLCRTLQAERTSLLNVLKENNIERPSLPSPVALPPPIPATNPANNTKVDAMVANCAQLRQSLAHLQSQLNVLTTNKNTNNKEETPKEKPNKKSKSKKSKPQDQKQEKSNNQSVPEGEDLNAVNDDANTIESVSPLDGNNTETENQRKIDDEFPSDKIDEKTVENLMQAINMANIDLCELEIEDNNIIDAESNGDVNGDSNKISVSGVLPEVTNLIHQSNANVTDDLKNSQPSISSSNEEVSHIVEVKPIKD